MTELKWDQVGDRRYETGIDRGVLYLQDGRAVPWNGLTGVEDSSTREAESHYIDGVKYLERQIPGDFTASLKAYTYPIEFDEVNGSLIFGGGAVLHNQPPKTFHLSYRTGIGDDLDGRQAGYRIHVVYNAFAIPDSISHVTIGSDTTPTEFSWAISAIPSIVVGAKPTAHISFDTTAMSPDLLSEIESRLYGTLTSDPDLPTMQELMFLVLSNTNILIQDNGDDTWTAAGPDANVVIIDDDTFEIIGVDGSVSADTFDISTTPLP